MQIQDGTLTIGESIHRLHVDQQFHQQPHPHIDPLWYYEYSSLMFELHAFELSQALPTYQGHFLAQAS